MFGSTLRLAAAATAVAMTLTPAIAVTQYWRAHHGHHYAHHYSHHYDRHHYARVQWYRGYSADAPIYGGIPDRSGCIPQCRYDTNPCDPPYFKMADGRCNPAQHGGFF
jgi:hypothetical protein